MKEFTIGTNDANQRLDRFLSKAVPLLPASLAQKYIRIKRIKLNGGRAERDTRLKAGDVLPLGEGLLRVIGPLTQSETENCNSLVLVAEASGGKMLLAGDMEFPEENSLLNAKFFICFF